MANVPERRGYFFFHPMISGTFEDGDTPTHAAWQPVFTDY
jgi:hypothetical protein